MIELLSLLQTVSNEAKKLSFELRIIGGVLRDILLGISSNDYDLVVLGDGITLADKVLPLIVQTQPQAKITKFENFKTAKIHEISGVISELDFATARSESYPKPGSLPVVAAADFVADAQRRDFSINTLAINLDDFIKVLATASLTEKSIDPYLIDSSNAKADLKAKVIRILHEKSFLDDPTRIFRACRYQARIKGNLEAKTKELLIAALNSKALDTISPARQLHEFRKILEGLEYQDSFLNLEELGVLRAMGFSSEPQDTQREKLTPKLVKAIELLKGYGPEDSSDYLDLCLLLILSNLDDTGAEKIVEKYSFGNKRLKRISRLKKGGKQKAQNVVDRVFVELL